MRAGDLDKRLVIEQVTLSNDGFGGGQSESWATFATVWGEELPMSARERFTSDQRYSVRTSRFRIRYLSGFTDKMRLNFDSKIWKILGLEKRGRNEEIVFLAEALD